MSSENNHISFEDTATAFSWKTDKELIKAKWLFTLISKPKMVAVGAFFAGLVLKLKLPLAGLVKATIFNHFCGGESLEESRKVIRLLGGYGIVTMLDHAIEGKKSDKQFDKTTAEILKIIEFTRQNEQVPVVTLKVTGIGRFELLEKQSQGGQLKEKQARAYQRIVDRLDKICASAGERGISVYIDAEESWIQEAIDDMTEKMMVKYNRERVVVFNTLQLYRHDRLAILEKMYQNSLSDQYYLGIKLVRGAYMDKERERAREMGYPSPIQPDKAATDRDFNKAIDFCLDHLDRIRFCAATHNEASCKHLAEAIEKRNIDKQDDRIIFSQLYGMSDHISFNLAKLGYNVGKYLPYGPVREVIPYLVRRAEENTSIAGQMGRELNLLKQELTRRNL